MYYFTCVKHTRSIRVHTAYNKKQCALLFSVIETLLSLWNRILLEKHDTCKKGYLKFPRRRRESPFLTVVFVLNRILLLSTILKRFSETEKVVGRCRRDAYVIRQLRKGCLFPICFDWSINKADLHRFGCCSFEDGGNNDDTSFAQRYFMKGSIISMHFRKYYRVFKCKCGRMLCKDIVFWLLVCEAI